MGERFTVDVKVSNVSQLYAVTFALQYDPNLLSIVEQETKQGDFLGDDVLFFQKVEDGMVSIAVAPMGDAEGVDGSGTVAIISLEALAAGAAKIEFIQDQRLSLTDPDGNNITGFNDIAVIHESIQIDATEATVSR